jgi:hypothetical protein
MADQNIKVKIDLDLAEFNKHAKELSNAISNVLGRDVDIFNGKIKQTAKDTNKATEAFKGATAAAGKAGSTVKQSNQQWTNFALILQDLPYGFRGIQNNLPAVIGGFAGMTGPIYLATSAIIALFTAWDAGFFKTKNATNALTEANKEYAESLKQSMGNAGEEISKMNALVSIAKDQDESMTKRLVAVKKLQEEYPSYFGNLDKETILNGNVKNAVDGVKSAIIERAKATAIAGKINKLSAEKFAKEEELYQLALQKTFKIQKAIQYVNQMKALGYTESAKHLKGLIDIQIKGIREEENVIKGTVDLIDKELTRLDAIYEDSTKKSIGLDIEQPQEVKSTYLKDFADALKEEERLFKDNLNNQLAFAEGNDIKKVEILGKAMSDLISWYDKGIIEETFYQNTLAELYRQTYNLKDGLLKKELSEKEKLAKEAEVIDNRQLQNSLDSLKIQSDVAMKIANLSGNATAADRIKILEDYKNKLYDLASTGGYTAEQFDKIDDALTRVDAAIDGSKDKVKDYSISWQETVNTINGILTSLDLSIIVNFAEQIGNMMAGGKFDITQMGTILADALSSIGKALIAFALTNGAAMELFKNPKTWPLALAAGIAAVAAGTALKAKISDNKATAFADGGIVSGPTMGLIGEYPGAQNNPEVIAPLDKLKSMIGGGGGGTFVLRGQDLLLATNRAQKASNLKGQNISLA